MKLIFSILLSVLSLFAVAQVNKVEFSEPIDLPKFGWNKVLLMRNGNTVLFHFESRKSILLKVFDRDHKEIASQKHLTKMVDLNALESSVLDGIYDINGEAVLFMTQQIDNKETFCRLRFDAVTAKLISEEKVIQSVSFKRRTIVHLLKYPGSDDYAAFCYEDFDVSPLSELKVLKFNAQHQLVKEIPLNITKGDYDAITFSGAGIDKNGGIEVSIILSKIVKYPEIMDRDLTINYLPPVFDQFLTTKVRIPQDVKPLGTQYSYNPFSNNINLLLTTYNIAKTRYGRPTDVLFFPMLLIAKEDMSSMKNSMLKYQKTNEYLQSQTDTNHYYTGNVTNMYTNDRGLTTVVSQFYNFVTGLNGDIGITQYNDDGEELWGTLIPKAHFNHEEKGPRVFKRELNIEVDNYISLHPKNSTYVLFNDLPKNLEKTSLIADSVYTYSHTNGLFYKVDRKREISKGYLFGAPRADESKVACIGSNSFDDKNNIFSSVIMHREGKKSSFKIAWCYLEP